MNDDLISRAALLEDVRICKNAVWACANHDYMIGYASALSGCEGQIAAAPAVDAEPVRHGKRTVYTIWHSSAWGEIHTKFECCGFDVRGTKKYNYCPNCGAKMDLEVES